MDSIFFLATVLIAASTVKGFLVIVGSFFDQGELGSLVRQNHRSFFTNPNFMLYLTFMTFIVVKLMAGFYAVEHGHSYILWLLMFEQFLPHGIYLVYIILRPFNNWAK